MWSILFADTATDTTITQFDCEISSLGRYIGKAGGLRSSIPIPNWEVGRRANRVIGGEGRMSIYAYRDGEIWWGGLLDSTNVSGGADGAQLDVSGSSFEAYPARREYRGDKTTWNMEQMALVPKLWNHMQSIAGGHVGVSTPQLDPFGNIGADTQLSGVTYALPLNRSETRSYASYMNEASNRENGYEWMVDVYAVDGARQRVLRTGWPQIGRPDFGYVVSYPGAIESYSIEGDSTEGAISWQARGKAPDPVGTPGGGTAERQDPIMSNLFTNDTLLSSGYWLTEATVDRDTVTEIPTLDKWAKLARDTRSGPLVLPEITADFAAFNPAVLGSNVRIRISDYPFPPGPNGEPGYEGMARCIGYEVDPGEHGNRDLVKLIFENPYENEKRIPA